MVYVEYPMIGSETIFTTVLSLWKLVLANLMLKPLLVEYHRDQLWVPYYSCFTSMTYLIALKNYRFVYLLMIQITSDNLLHLESIMNEELNSVFKYCNINKLSINFAKTTYVVISSTRLRSYIHIPNVAHKTQIKYLDQNLHWGCRLNTLTIN